MAATFSPEDLKVRDPEGLQFSDAWGLTCAQLGLSVGELLRIRPDARLTREDLAGYHFIQYGIEADIVKQTIEVVEGGMWSDWDQAQTLRNTLPRMLGEQTIDALTFRIRLGSPAAAERLEIDTTFPDHFDVVLETDHLQGEAVSLYPQEGVELAYRGRTEIDLGSVVMGQFITDLTVYTDVLDLSNTDDSQAGSIIAMSTNRGYPPAIQTIRVI